MQLSGIHHLTAVTADARGNHDFYTKTMGLRLVKKTVNQDDTSAYHLFYADGKGSPGTDITFFDWPAPRERRGTHSIARTGFRVQGEKAFSYWTDRLKAKGLKVGEPTEKFGRITLDFEDFEGVFAFGGVDNDFITDRLSDERARDRARDTNFS